MPPKRKIEVSRRHFGKLYQTYKNSGYIDPEVARFIEGSRNPKYMRFLVANFMANHPQFKKPGGLKPENWAYLGEYGRVKLKPKITPKRKIARIPFMRHGNKPAISIYWAKEKKSTGATIYYTTNLTIMEIPCVLHFPVKQEETKVGGWYVDLDNMHYTARSNNAIRLLKPWEKSIVVEHLRAQIRNALRGH
ncbi:MAG: hypothetical protein AABW99_01120 [archaeon]